MALFSQRRARNDDDNDESGRGLKGRPCGIRCFIKVVPKSILLMLHLNHTLTPIFGVLYIRDIPTADVKSDFCRKFVP